MPRYNVLIGCDQNYYDQWAVPLLQSIHTHSPWVQLHCHIVNPSKVNKLDNVDITTEYINFISNESRISYLQCVRFLVVANKFSKNENVITLDADSICTQKFSKEEFSLLFERQYVLKHHKEDRWLAGFVSFNNNGFRQEYSNSLKAIPVDDWKWGRDQTIMATLSDEYRFKQLPEKWMSIGKNKTNSIFLTLKGNQKYKEKYLNIYNQYRVK